LLKLDKLYSKETGINPLSLKSQYLSYFCDLIFKEMADLSQEEWVEQLNADANAFILDVRTRTEVSEGYIPNASNIDIYLGQQFLAELEKLDKSKSYYVYCRSGNRSRQACAIMNNVGFENAYNLEGGIIAWQGDVAQ